MPVVASAGHGRRRYAYPPLETERCQSRVTAAPVSEISRSGRRALIPLPAARRPEKADDYPDVVARLNALLASHTMLQRYPVDLQQRKGQWDGMPNWQGRYFCRTSSGLLNCIREYCGPVSAEELGRLKEGATDAP